MHVPTPHQLKNLSLPEGLARELDRREAKVVGVTGGKKGRTYLRAQSPEGDVFARYSDDPDYPMVLAHDLEVRARIGTHGALRSPPVIASGSRWAVERAIDTHPLTTDALRRIVVAVRELAGKDLPAAPGAAGSKPSDRLRAKWREFRRPKHPLWDEYRNALILYKRIRESSTLALVTGHGDLTTNNILFTGDEVWLVDWENLGPSVAGADLMRLWPFLDDREQRSYLLDRAVEMVGSDNRGQLLTLRYFFLLKSAVTALGLRRGRRNQDPERGKELLALLPGVRAEANVRP